MSKKINYIMVFIIIAGGFSFYNFSQKPEQKKTETVRSVDTQITETIKKPSGEIIVRKIITKEKARTKTSITVKKHDWNIGASSSISAIPVYGINVERRVLGNVYVGGYVRSDKEFGLSISLSF